MNGTDRITYLKGEYTKYGEPIIDEVIMANASVHLELLDDSCYMLIVDNSENHWHLTIHNPGGRAKVVARLFESWSK